MSLSPMKPILEQAARQGTAVASFTAWSLDSALAIVEAANACQRPVIMMTGPLEIRHVGKPDWLVQLARMAAERAETPVALHLDHAELFDDVQAAIDAGFTSVMIDASAKPFDENVELTRAVVECARKSGVTVEAELGRIGGTEGNIVVNTEDACQTDPEQAREFVRLTGVDALAVGIGSVHGVYPFPPKLNIPRLQAIRAATELPLVLHGGSGIPAEQVRDAIASGIAKINVCTDILIQYGRAMADAQQAPGFKYSVPSLMGPSRDAARAFLQAKIDEFALR